MRLIMRGKNVWTLLFLTGVTLMSGCGGGGSDKEEEIIRPRFIVQGSFYRISHESEKDQALYYDAFVTGRGNHGSTNLARWTRKGEHQVVRNLSSFRSRDGTGRLTSGSAEGAVEPDSELFFLMGPGKGLSLFLKQPEDEETVSESDLSGTYSCVRQLTKPTDSIQWFEAEFNNDGFVYTTPDGSFSASHELEEDGRFRITSDTGLEITEEELQREAETQGFKTETLFGGAFQKQKHFLAASYMIGEVEPLLGESLPGSDKRPGHNQVTTHGLLLCMKGGANVQRSDLQGDYWFGHMESNSGTYDNSFGYVRADGQGRLSRIECSHSSTSTREWEMEYEVNTDGYGSLRVSDLNSSAGPLDMQGVLSADGAVALLMTENNNGIDLLVKKRASSGCPER